MVDRRHDRAERRAVTLQLVRDQAKRNPPLTLQELEKEALRRATVTPGLDEDVDHITVLIDRTPKILPFAVDRDGRLRPDTMYLRVGLVAASNVLHSRDRTSRTTGGLSRRTRQCLVRQADPQHLGS